MSRHIGAAMYPTFSPANQPVTAELLLAKAKETGAFLSAFEQDIIVLNTELTYRLGTSRVASALKTLGLTYVGHFETLKKARDHINGLISQASQLDQSVDAQELDLALQKLVKLEDAVCMTYLQGIGTLAEEIQKEEDNDFAGAFAGLDMNKEACTGEGLENLMDALRNLCIRSGTGGGR
jgi:hypothetical protein